MKFWRLLWQMGLLQTYAARKLRSLFAPRGNLLVADILAETTVHVLSNGERKAIISKFEDTPDQRVRQQLVQALVFTAIDIARERGIAINWSMVAAMYPMPAPPAPPPPPPPAAPA